MTRDTQIGLLLAVGFLALVGGVLYYRIEHPDELEQFWNGNQEVASTAPAAGGTPDSTQTAEAAKLPAVPSSTAPILDSGNSSLASSGNPVQLTSGQSPPMPPAASSAMTPAAAAPLVGSPPNSSAPTLDLNVGSTPPPTKLADTMKSGATNAPSTAATSPPSLPVPSGAPDLLAGASPPVVKPTVPAPPEKSPLDAFKSEPPKMNDKSSSTAGAISPPAPALPAPSAASPPSLTFSPPPPATKTEETKAAAKPPESPSAPSLAFSAPETSKPPPTTTSPQLPTPAMPTPPGLDAPKAASDSTKLPSASDSMWNTQPPNAQVPPTAAPVKSTPLPSPPEITGSGSLSANSNNTIDHKSTPVSPPLGSNPPSPERTERPIPDATDLRVPTTTRDDGPYREYAKPRTGLGRPVPDSVIAMNERRWSDGSSVTSPIIPSAGEVRPDTGTMATPPQRKVISDSPVNSTRAVQGETFSSLSQRAYGSEQFAEALAAYNREAGLVENDQPAGNQLVLLPARFDLENRYSHLLRKTPTRAASPRNSAGTTSPTPAAARDPRAIPTSGPVYRVRANEQLFDVAKMTLGDGYRWSEIYTLNKDMFRDSTELRPDMVLRLPVDAKVDIAKPR